MATTTVASTPAVQKLHPWGMKGMRSETGKEYIRPTGNDLRLHRVNGVFQEKKAALEVGRSEKGWHRKKVKTREIEQKQHVTKLKTSFSNIFTRTTKITTTRSNTFSGPDSKVFFPRKPNRHGHDRCPAVGTRGGNDEPTVSIPLFALHLSLTPPPCPPYNNPQ